jgi:hypothetical protein
MPIGNLKVDGGMTANKLFNQLLSDHLGRAIYCSNFTEVTGWFLRPFYILVGKCLHVGLGAAISAGLCIGLLTVESLSKYSSNTVYFLNCLTENNLISRNVYLFRLPMNPKLALMLEKLN